MFSLSPPDKGLCAVGFAVSPHWASDFSSTKLEPPKIPQLGTVSRLKEVTLCSGWVSVTIEPIIGQRAENEYWWSCSDGTSLSPSLATLPGDCSGKARDQKGQERSNVFWTYKTDATKSSPQLSLPT